VPNGLEAVMPVETELKFRLPAKKCGCAEQGEALPPVAQETGGYEFDA
jgi:hypothetical protein